VSSQAELSFTVQQGPFHHLLLQLRNLKCLLHDKMFELGNPWQKVVFFFNLSKTRV
jgi:hypothetical protein